VASDGVEKFLHILDQLQPDFTFFERVLSVLACSHFSQGLLSQLPGFTYLAMKIRDILDDDQCVPWLIGVMPERLGNGVLHAWLSFRESTRQKLRMKL
jgi:hypothetical protein